MPSCKRPAKAHRLACIAAGGLHPAATPRGGSDIFLSITEVANTAGEFMHLHDVGALAVAASALKASFQNIALRHRVQIHVLGGSNGDGEWLQFNVLASAERYDPSSHQWEPSQDFVSAIGKASAATADGQFYICGGRDEDDIIRSSLHRFDGAASRWEPVQPMTTCRMGAAVVAMHGSIYVCGGCGSDEINLESVERFDP